MFTLKLLVVTFIAPLLTAIVMVASVAVLHHNWWAAVPLIQYWPAYWFGVVATGLGIPTVIAIGALVEWLFD